MSICSLVFNLGFALAVEVRLMSPREPFVTLPGRRAPSLAPFIHSTLTENVLRAERWGKTGKTLSPHGVDSLAGKDGKQNKLAAARGSALLRTVY